MPEGQENSGFLKDYANLKPNPKMDSDALTFVNADAAHNLRRYVAIIVDPVEIYVSTKADDAMVPERARETVALYFRHALQSAVGDAFPIVETPGPLVLRLRAAIVGVDAGGAVAPMDDAALTAKPLDRAIVLEKVAVEMELVDSVTGERVAAMVDRTKLGAGAEVGSENFSRVARFSQAKDAFDEWARRVRMFLDTEHEHSGEDATKADQSYRPYGQ
ncbi:MAG: DUF3313 domain-containing protein [Candidatus Solibacter sp.]|nr:DUF3313 domain-containing protein [Candidatus Solibacter sp.]